MAKDKSKDKTSLKKIRTSFLSRSGALAKLGIQMTTGYTRHKVGSLLSSKENEARWLDFLKKQAGLLSSEIGDLKGSLMKAGQMLSVYGEYFLPPEVNQFLKTMQSESKPLEWEAIEKHLKTYLTKAQLADLEIEKEALASASLGQVHRARVKSTQELIVLKIQYPNVDRAIDTDLKALKTFINFLGILPANLDLKPLFAEVKEMLVQEMDYRQEAQMTKEFAERLKKDPRFIIPRVIDEFCSEKVLATSFERGLRVDDPLIQSLSIERRNRLASNFLDLYFKELFQWETLQTDPHAGNYRLRINPSGSDQIILFDFGATRKFDPKFMNAYHHMVKGAVMSDEKMFLKASHDLKFLRKDDPEQLTDAFKEFCYETVEPFLEPTDARRNALAMDDQGLYDWKKTDLPQRISAKVLKILREFPLRTPPRELVFLDRKTGGVFVFLHMLGAKFNARKVILPYLENLK